MHICFLTPEYPHPNIGTSGGLGTSIKNLATQLAARDFEVSVVVFGKEKSAVFIENTITFHILKQQRHTFLGFYINRKFIAKYLNRLIEKEGVNLIEAPDWTGITAFMKLDAPLVIRIHGSDAYFCHLDRRKQKKKNYFFEKLALKGATAVTSVSAFAAELTRSIFNLEDDITVIPNGIDINKFEPHPETEIPARVLYFGSLIRKKGVLELPDIFNKINREKPDVEFVFAGKDVVDIFTGKSTHALIVSGLNESTRFKTVFLGELSYEAIQNEIAKATVVVLPSYAEALPMSWLEAMAMEKALVTSNIGWAEEMMIDGVTGYTVSPDDHDAYMTAVLLLLEDPQLRKVLGKQAREYVVQHFSTQKTIAQNMAFYEEIMAKKK